LPVFDYAIFDKLDELKKQYESNMSNGFIRSALLSLDLSYEVRGGIEGLTDRLDYFKHQGYRFEELYNGVYGMAVFIYRARVEVVPHLKNSPAFSRVSDSEKILASMAANNLNANLDLLSDRVNDLYLSVVKVDIDSHKVKSPVYERMPELGNLGKLLTSSEPGLL